MMENVLDFMTAALPWIAMGLLLAVFFVRAAAGKKGKNRREDCSSEGMAFGLCFGVALGTATHINTGLGLIAGLALGFLVGSGIEKKRTDGNDSDPDDDEGHLSETANHWKG